MVEFTKMSTRTKLDYVLKNIKIDYVYIPAFLLKHLGNQGVEELQAIWQQGFRQIPENISAAEKFEIAYSNWIWLAKNTYSFIRRQLGEDGIRQFECAEIEMLKGKTPATLMHMLKLVRLLSPGSAFMIVARQLTYQLQWFTPLLVPELTRHRLVVQVPHCKILDFADTDDLCCIGCQSTYSIWMAEQFWMAMQTECHDGGCTKILTRL